MAEQQRQGHRASQSSPFVQVCDRCRWKKIKCDGNRPYLEERIRQLEGQRETAWSPQASDSRHSPYGEAHLRNSSVSQDSSDHPKKRGLPDWTVLKELGTHVIDEDGFTRYMGPSSGVGFSAKVLQEILDDDQPEDPEFYNLFNLDDFARARALEEADSLLWQVVPTNLPDRKAADKVIEDFFIFTERVFPILHKGTFLQMVDDLYGLETIGPEWFELLSQFYFTLSIGHAFNSKMSNEERSKNQIRGLQTAVRCFYTTLHTRRDGLTRLQTLALHSYSLILLRQRTEAGRLTAMANTKALECGLHHDGQQFAGNPLETEMRRRVFWCVFMLHLFNCSLAGLPRALHEADITVAEPSDIDDDQLTTTQVLNSLPGRTKIHRFVSVCRLIRILSRTLDVLYTYNKRKHASTRIEQMNRLCCEHLLDQLDFDFQETPDDLPHDNTEEPEQLAILASFANEQMLYYYVRWLIHRPGLALGQRDPQFSSSLQICTESASELLKVADVHKSAMPFIKANPAIHPCTAFIAGLTPLYRTSLLRSMPGTIPMLGYSAENDLEVCQHALSVLAHLSHGHSDTVRRRTLQDLVKRVFGEDHEELSRLDSIASYPEANPSASEQQSSESPGLTFSGQPMEYHFEQLEHFNAHEDLRNLVHDAFSPGTDPWHPSPHYHLG